MLPRVPLPTSILVSSINNFTFPLRLLSTNRKLNDLNQGKIEEDSIDVWLLRIVELNALEAILEECEQE